MRKLWNTEKRQYEWVAENIWIVDKDYTVDDAEKKWNSRHPDSVRTRVLKGILNRYVDEGKHFDKMHEFFDAVRGDVIALNHAYVTSFRGKSPGGNQGYAGIADVFKPGVVAIAKETGGDYSRGRHTTCPSIAHANHPYREYQLLALPAQTSSRLTTALYDGQLFLYWSTSHVEGTYNYHLVTFMYDDDGTPVEMPLSGRSRDKLITLPF